MTAVILSKVRCRFYNKLAQFSTRYIHIPRALVSLIPLHKYVYTGYDRAILGGYSNYINPKTSKSTNTADTSGSSYWLLTWVTYLVTWVDYPSCPKGRDLNFSLKESSDGARTTASGRLFQELTTRCEKKLDLICVRANGFTSFWLLPRSVRCDCVK